MMNVARQQPAQIIGILTGSTAAAFMQKESDAINILKDSLLGGRRRLLRDPMISRWSQFLFAIESGKFRNLAPVQLRSGKSKLFFESLFQHLNILVFAENQRHDEPVIARANLTIGPFIALEFRLTPV